MVHPLSCLLDCYSTDPASPDSCIRSLLLDVITGGTSCPSNIPTVANNDERC